MNQIPFSPASFFAGGSEIFSSFLSDFRVKEHGARDGHDSENLKDRNEAEGIGSPADEGSHESSESRGEAQGDA